MECRNKRTMERSQMTRTCILHVEDQEDDVFFLQQAFRRAGITQPVQVVTDGQQATDYLEGVGDFADREKYPLPFLVLLDLNLPFKSGLEVLEWLRSRPMHRAMVVVALTSSNQEADIHRAYELGANSYVVKPSAIQQQLEMAQHLKGSGLLISHRDGGRVVEDHWTQKVC
jgi:CheY-like chemotaxis protein